MVLSVLAGCERNPVKPAREKPSESAPISTSDSLSVSDSDSLGTLILTIERENEYYTLVIRGEAVISSGSYEKGDYSSEHFSFESDTLTFSKPSGDYHIFFQTRVKIKPTNSSVYIGNSYNVIIERNQTVQLHIAIPQEAPLQVVVMSAKRGQADGVPIRGAEVIIEPETITDVTDDEGRADFGGTFLLSNYKEFIDNIWLNYLIRKNNLEFYKLRGYCYINNTNGVYEQTIKLEFEDLQPPEVEIITPDNLHYENTFEILLQGDGDDFENDPFPDEYLVWHSNIDGELGSGRELIVSNLSEGNHIITLVGTDSHNYTDQDSISLEISYYNDESYYPVPYSGYWNYKYDNTDFTVTYIDGEDEHWTLISLEANADEGYTRSSVLVYAITRDDSTNYCRYEVADLYETDDENIYIAKTIEQLLVYNDETMNTEPLENLDIETVYSPRYLLIQDYMNPKTSSTYNADCISESTFNYWNAKSYSYSHTEAKNISAEYEYGEPETIDTGLGPYDAVPLTIRSDGTERILWLAKGIGIAKLSYDSFGFPLTASMTDTNVPSFSGVGPSVVMWKPAVHGDNAQIELNAADGTPERMMELSKILKGFCPR